MWADPFVIAHRRRRHRRGDPRPRSPQAGQIVPLVAVALVLAGLLGLGLVRLAGADAQRAGAQAAADASALAGAAEGRQGAEEVARANEAVIVVYRSRGLDVVVVVERRGIRAEARARWAVSPAAAHAKRPRGTPTLRWDQ